MSDTSCATMLVIDGERYMSSYSCTWVVEKQTPKTCEYYEVTYRDLLCSVDSSDLGKCQEVNLLWLLFTASLRAVYLYALGDAWHLE